MSGRTASKRTRSQTTPLASLCFDVVPENEPAPIETTENRTRNRRKWTTSMKEEILRIYFRVTDCEESRTGFRQRLHAAFQDTYPEFSATEQHVADQLRLILNGKNLPESRRSEIRSEVQQELRRMLEVDVENTYTNEPTQIHQITPLQETNTEKMVETNELLTRLRRLMKQTEIEYRDMNPQVRPNIPRIKSSRKLTLILWIMNQVIIPEYLDSISDLHGLKLIIYCAATTVSKELGVWNPNRQQRPRRQFKPAWERRLQNKIASLRIDIGRLHEYVRGNVRAPRLQRLCNTIIERVSIHTRRDQLNMDHLQCLDILRQRLSVYSTRLARYQLSRSRKQDNKNFYNSERNLQILQISGERGRSNEQTRCNTNVAANQ